MVWRQISMRDEWPTVTGGGLGRTRDEAQHGAQHVQDARYGARETFGLAIMRFSSRGGRRSAVAMAARFGARRLARWPVLARRAHATTSLAAQRPRDSMPFTIYVHWCVHWRALLATARRTRRSLVQRPACSFPAAPGRTVPSTPAASRPLWAPPHGLDLRPTHQNGVHVHQAVQLLQF